MRLKHFGHGIACKGLHVPCRFPGPQWISRQAKGVVNGGGLNEKEALTRYKLFSFQTWRIFHGCW